RMFAHGWRATLLQTHEPNARLRRLASQELTPAELRAVRQLLEAAFGADTFGDNHWQHALGGMHFLVDIDGTICAHASVIERRLPRATAALDLSLPVSCEWRAGGAW